MKLLLIEDEKRMAQALIRILRLENYEVDHCSDGVSGLQFIESGVYDIIILDVMLPGMNGFDIAKQARQLISILLDNALHHCTENGEITFSLYAERNTVYLSVANDGDEIPPESRDKIFERFYRADSARK